MKVYLLNALITPFKSGNEKLTVFAMQKITKGRYEEILRQLLEKKIKIVSAIGFHDTVKFLQETLSPTWPVWCATTANRSTWKRATWPWCSASPNGVKR